MAYGLRPIRHALGGTIRHNAFRDYDIASGYATDLFAGDPVKVVADGSIERAAAGDTLVGVFLGVSYKDSATGEFKYSQHWPASTTATDISAQVVDDPYVVFQVEADQDTTALASADRGNNVDIVVAAGSSVTKQSGTSADSDTKVSTTAQLRVLQSAEDDKSFTSAGTTMDIEVMINEHFWKTTVGV